MVRRQKLITASFLIALLIYATVALNEAANTKSTADSNDVTSSQRSEYWGSSEYEEYDEEEEYGSGYDVNASGVNVDEAHDDDAGYGDVSSAGSVHDHDTAGSTGREGNSQPFQSLTSRIVSESTMVATLIFLTAAMLYYASLYRRSRSPMIAGFLLSAIFLIQAEICMSFGTVWYASWWQYHVLMLAAFIASSLGLVVQYSRSGSVQGVIEGLLARTTVERLQTGYTDVIVALVAAVEAKDHYTRGHTQRVAELALRIGDDLRLSPDRLRMLGQAAMLHDIGKIGVPDSILNKPGKLTEEEFAIVKQHPSRAYEMVKGIRSLAPSLSGILYHHERLDGSGYPDGLTGDAISLDARIIAVADVFDALTSERSYRKGWSIERAILEIERDAGTKLDAPCVASLKRVLGNLHESVATPARAHLPSHDFHPAAMSSD